MNYSHQTALEELKADLDEEFGEEAVWINTHGNPIAVFGIFSSVDKERAAKSNSKQIGQLTVDAISASFSMAHKSVPGKEGDQLVVNGEIYQVLKFKPGDFETIIPLKPTQNRSHNWRAPD